MPKQDRRIQRTRESLQNTLIEMLRERNYDSITVQEIVDCANVGRTTFYDHYIDKNDLFLHCHATIVHDFHKVHSQPDTLLMSDASSDMVSAYQKLIETRDMLLPLFQTLEGTVILRRIRDESAKEIGERLRATYSDAESTIPIDMLAGYLAGAQIALMQWWLENR